MKRPLSILMSVWCGLTGVAFGAGEELCGGESGAVTVDIPVNPIADGGTYCCWGVSEATHVGDFTPEAPEIHPASGTTFDTSLTITISCATEGATIRYTLDGSEPTEESTKYTRFRIYGKTTVKARAFGANGEASGTTVAEYAFGICETPVINAVAEFSGTDTKVEIACATEGAWVYYTLDGSTPNSHSTRYTGPFYLAESCTVKAFARLADYLDSAVAVKAVTKVWVIGDTMGRPDHAFATGGDAGFVRTDDATIAGGESMRSGAITHNQRSEMSTAVVGAGTVTFKWKTSCEEDVCHEWDRAEFLVDGEVAEVLDGVTSWNAVECRIRTDGAHTLVWRYVKDKMESVGDDCCWVAEFGWDPDVKATRTTATPVPYSWLRAYYPHIHDEYADYEAGAKEMSANGLNTVEESYVAGLDPTNGISVLRAEIEMTEGGPRVSWKPDLNEGGTKNERLYRVWGKEALDEAFDWECPANPLHRFFKVTVEMPQGSGRTEKTAGGNE